MSDYEINKFTENGFTVTIGYDIGAWDPHREDESPGCALTMWGRHYDFPNDAGINMDDFRSWGEVADDLREQGALVVLPVWVYEHSGISLTARARVGQYADRWDSAQCGVAYITPKIWAYLSSEAWTGSEAQVERATRSIVNHVDMYSQYVNGEIYCWSVEDWDGEIIDSGGAFYDIDECESEAREVARTTEHTPKCNGHLVRVFGEIEHDDRTCPLHYPEGGS